MANYAKVVDNIVTKVIVAEASFFDTFVDDNPGIWIESSSAAIGDTYDAARSAFVSAKPYASWTLNESTNQWTAPTAYPDDDKVYNWNEDTTAWVEVT
tara:strand:+ start:616 stop:909 length:294 start_codon:yes stop_codon:yes gene_type:complete